MTLDSSVFLGGSVIAAVVAGVIALFAPCCISVMLPAYFASSFQNRRILTAMTFLFAAGIATVILPLAMGASLLRQIFLEEHTTVYLAGGAPSVSVKRTESPSATTEPRTTIPPRRSRSSLGGGAARSSAGVR